MLEPPVIGVGTLVTSTTSGATLAPAYPAGYTAIDGDYVFILYGGRPNGNVAPTAPGGYTEMGKTFVELGTNDLYIGCVYKKLTAGEAIATLTVPAVYSGVTAGIGAFSFVIRGLDPTTPLNGSVVTGTAATAAATFKVNDPSTSVQWGIYLAAAVSSDDNNLNLSNSGAVDGRSEVFTVQAGGASYATTAGGDFSFGVATAPGSPTINGTWPTWNQSVNGNDSWVGFNVALRAALPSGATTEQAVNRAGTY